MNSNKIKQFLSELKAEITAEYHKNMIRNSLIMDACCQHDFRQILSILKEEFHDTWNFVKQETKIN